MLSKPLLVWLLSIIFPSCLDGHQDTVLKLENGRLIGLPEQYAPAKFNFQSQTLSIAGKALVLPPNLKSLFQQPTNLPEVDPFNPDAVIKMGVPKFKYRFLTSWYHDKVDGNLPSYLLIRVEPPNCTYAFEISIDLDGMKLLGASVSTAAAGNILLDIEPEKVELERGEQSVPPKSDRAGG